MTDELPVISENTLQLYRDYAGIHDSNELIAHLINIQARLAKVKKNRKLKSLKTVTDIMNCRKEKSITDVYKNINLHSLESIIDSFIKKSLNLVNNYLIKIKSPIFWILVVVQVKVRKKNG